MANYKYLEVSGVIVPDTSLLQTEVEGEFKNSFGDDLIVGPHTPQGVLITDETLSRSEVVRNNAQLANQINPNLAGGVYLLALCALLGLEASPGTYTIIPGVVLNGVPGTVIPTTVKLKDADNNLFSPISIVTLNSLGTATINFRALEVGQIQVAPSTLAIDVGVLGLETVNNPNASVPGSSEQTDESLRLLRNQTLALQGNGLAEATLSRLNITAGVTSAVFRENPAGTTEIIDGVTMIAHSMYACVDGGTDLDVAMSLTDVKGGGCSYNNGPGVNISQPITNPFSNQTINVLFDRPNYLPFLVEVTVVVNPAVVTDPVAAVKQAILDYAAGLIDGELGLGIGIEVSSFELAGAINREVPSLFVTNLQTQFVSGGSFSSAPLPVEIYERATIEASGITVIVTT